MKNSHPFARKISNSLKSERRYIHYSFLTSSTLRLIGTNLKSQLKDPECLGHSALAFQRNRITIRTKEYRLIVHKGGFVELYNFSDISGVSVNQAKEKPEVVHALTKQLKKRFNWEH